MDKTLVFCISDIDSDPLIHQDWIDYYTVFFHGLNVDLIMVNDGPNEKLIDLKEVGLIVLEPHLGKEDGWICPGNKRSFYYALIHSLQEEYSKIALIGTDCYIHKKAKEEYLKFLFSDGYHIGFSKSVVLPESSLQIINEKWVTNYLIDRYSCHDNWFENINFEKMLMMILKPNYILNGDKKENFKEEYDFVSNCTYKEFLELYQKHEKLL